MDYPSNSRSEQGKNEDPKPEGKQIQKVTMGEVVRRRKPLGKRMTEAFVGGDARSVWGYVTLDVLLPAAKDTIADAVSQGIERMLFGEARSTSRRTGRRPGSVGPGYTNYREFAGSPTVIREEPRGISRRSRANHNFDEIVLATRVEAEAVIDRLFDLVSRYETATVADLYELVGVSGNYTDEKWGWSDIRGAKVERVRGGYLLDLPKPELLD